MTGRNRPVADVSGTTARLQGEGDYIDDLRTGRHVEWDPAGEVVAETTYDGGELHGPSQTFYPDGSVLEEGDYERGFKSGPWVSYHGTGEVRARGSYVQGGTEGEWEFFDPFGRLVLEAVYVDLRAHGEWRAYEYEDEDTDEPTVAAYEVFVYVHGVAHGTWRGFFADDRPLYTQEWRNDLENGPLRSWWPNGQQHREGQFSDGISIGHWRWVA